MVKSKKLKIAMASIFTASAVSLSAAAIMLAGGTQTAYAARPVTLDGSTIFYTTLRGAEITYSAPETVTSGEESKQCVYTMFKLEGDEKVDMRNHLAYSWIESVKDGDGKATAKGAEKKFSMEIGFPSADFTKYVLKFQSQQYVYSDKNITENFIVATPTEDKQAVELSVTDSLTDLEGKKIAATYPVGSRINLAFGDFENGSYKLLVNGSDSGKTFDNVYEPYAAYVSSGDNAVTPLSFSAEFAADAPAGTDAEMILYSLNGQSFELKNRQNDEEGSPLTDADGNPVYDLTVSDDASPVLCYKSTPSYVQYGKTLEKNYEVIDVLTKSPRSTAYYYVLSADQYKAEDYDYDKNAYDNSDDNPFKQCDSDMRIIRKDDTFIPSVGGKLSEDIYGLVKLYIKISDTNSSDSPTDYVYVDWYAKKDALVDIYELKSQINGVPVSGDSHSYFLKLIDEKPGVTYADAAYAEAEDYSGVDVLARYKETIESVQSKYQTAIENAIAGIKDDDGNPVGKLYAGSDSKFYLPSLQPVFKEVYGDGENLLDDYCAISDYKYTLYYKGNTTGSNDSLAYNKLALSLPDADTDYRFTIYITDSFGNPMRYPAAVENNEIVWKTIEKEDVWDEEYDGLLPRFSFHVYYKEATAKNPEKLSLAYVGTTYNGVSFDVKGVSNTYTSTYKLYVFDRNAMFGDTGENVDYDKFNGKFNELFAGDATRKYFTTVKPASELLETDDRYDEFKAINWNAGNATFTPQSVEDFYVVELTVTDNQTQYATKYYATIAPSIATTPLKGESDWAEKNLASIILLSVAAACFIGLVILLIVKPKDKGDIDAVYSEEEEKKAAKAEKKASKKKAGNTLTE